MLRRSWIGRGILCALAALLAFAPGRASAAGGSLSYEDAVGEALRHSARLKVKNEEIHINEASWRQSLSSLYPTIALNGRLERFGNLAGPTGIGTINGQVVGGLQDEWRSSVFVLGEYTLSNWFKKRYESHYYERLTEASIHDSEAEKKKVVLEVTDLYGSLAEGAIRLRYLGQMIDRMKEAVSLRAAAHKEGEISHEDLLRAEVQVVDLEKERTEAARQFKENLTRLTLYTGIEYEEDVMVQSLGAAAEVAERPEPERVEQTPEYRAKRKEVEAQQEKGRAARNNLLPDVGVYGRYDFYGRNPEVYDSMKEMDKNSWNAGVYISIPLFDGGLRKWERERAAREIRRQEESLRALRQEKGRDSAGLFVKLRELDRTIAQYRQLLVRYEKLLAIASGAAALGGRSRAELLESGKEALAIERDMEVYVNQRAVAVRKYRLETDFASAMGDLDGNGTDRH
ncbi:MAG: TolC family protein [Syntrophales bacterium]|jgi:outer membrane protein TolC|nr:TolC family protein [Syntrophales bacterium]MCU0554892.1 TolC family protein [Syntrophales bacterium]